MEDTPVQTPTELRGDALPDAPTDAEESSSPTDAEESTSRFSEEDTARQEQNFIDYYMGGDMKPLGLMLRLYRGHYVKLLLSAFFFLLKTSPVWFMPMVTGTIIDLLNKHGAGQPVNFQVILWWLGIELILVAQNVPTHYLHVRFFAHATRSVEAGLRGAMVRKLQQLSITFHKEMQSGRIQSKIMRDVEAIEMLFSQVFMSLLSIVVNITVALVVVGTKNILVFFFFLGCVPFASGTIFAFRGQLRARNRAFRKEIERTSANVMDMVALIPVTRAHALEDLEVQRMTSQLNLMAEKGYRLDVVQSMFGAAGWVVFQCAQLFCLAVTSFMAFRGQITVGDVTVYQSYFATVVGQVSALLGLLPTLTRGTESIGSVGEILNARDIEDNTDKTAMQKLRGEYVFKDVYFHYTQQSPVLAGLNLTVKQGETVALVGESGAGKSTVLNLVIGFNIPTAGELLVDGQNIASIDLHSYRKHIAVVPQTSILFTGSIRDNITYGQKRVSAKRLAQALEAANLTQFVSSLPEGLDTVVGEGGGKLSGGQRQRVSIARAIIRDPRVIIFDEATSALDSVSEREIQAAMNNLTRGRTTFIVAHRLSTIRDADKIAVLRGGVCVEYGTYDELMALEGEFYRMKALQS